MGDGGSAFPKQPIHHFPDGSSVVSEQGGMSLHDWFAGHALTGLLATEVHSQWNASIPMSAAARAYAIADAMLAERERRNG